ncbi:MAG: glutathione synthase, partial [Nitrospinota bacterium]
MSLAFAFILDPFDALDFVADTSFHLMAECERQGHTVFAVEAADLAAAETTPTGRAVPVAMDTSRGWVPHGPATVMPLGAFDCVFMRKEPPFDMAYLYATYILELAPPSTFVINDPRGLRDANEKLYTLHFPTLIPETLVARTKADLKTFMERVGGAMIIKPLGDYGGRDVFICRPNDPNLGPILDGVTAKGRQLVLAQRYLPEVTTEGDKRILVLDGEPIGAFLRRPSPGDHRANLSAGGTAEPAEVTAADRALCAALKGRLAADGLYFVGIDVIGGRITEINVTCPAGVYEIDQFAGTNSATPVIEF